MRRVPWIVAIFLAVGTAAWMSVSACGPDTTDAHFEALPIPDTPPGEFAAGKLGILHPGFRFKDRVIAYRWLKGLGLSPADRRALAPPDDETELPKVEGWGEARAAVLKGQAPIHVEFESPASNWNTYQRIGDDAWEVAGETLRDRLKAHGDGPDLRAWIAAQDQVFASTKEHPSIPAPVAAPAWLKADRDYQIAAARFYAEQFDAARAGFAAIAKDEASPWRPWAPYLEARCLARKASLAPEIEDKIKLADGTEEGAGSHPDPALWKDAQAQTEVALATAPNRRIFEAAGALRDFVRHRTEPEALFADDLEVLATGGSHLTPVMDSARWVVLRGLDPDPAVLTGPNGKPGPWRDGASDLLAWLWVMDREGSRNPGAADLAYQKWRAGGGIPWLTAALVLCPGPGSQATELAAAAAFVPGTDPASQTLRWNVARLRALALPPEERRAALDRALKAPQPAWARNTLSRLRGAVAGSVEDWMGFADQDVTGYRLELDNLVTPRSEFKGDDAKLPSQLLGVDPAAVLNQSFSAARLTQAAQAPGLRKELREDVAAAAWMRAGVLDQWELARAAAPLLPTFLRSKAMAACALEDAEARRFAFARIVMDDPDLRLWVQPGLGSTQAVSGYRASLYSWWCSSEDWSPSAQYGVTDTDADDEAPVQGKPLVPAFLTPEDLKTAATERTELKKIPAPQIWFGHIVLDYAKAHPKDPAVPEALASLVATTRMPDCRDKGISLVSREAFRILHTSYKDTPAAKRTKYYF